MNLQGLALIGSSLGYEGLKVTGPFAEHRRLRFSFSRGRNTVRMGFGAGVSPRVPGL